MKTFFWDTSALLGLVFDEPSSERSAKAWELSDADFAWRWLVVEAFAALTRRKASHSQWEKLHKIIGKIQLIDFPPHEMDALCRINQKWALRAADAGHLYVFSQLTIWVPEVELVCCDEDMLRTSHIMGYKVWAEDRPSGLNEPIASYGRPRHADKSKKQIAYR